MLQFCVLRTHGVKLSENWITFEPSPHIKSPLEIYVYAYKCLKNIGIVTKFGMSVCFANQNYVHKLSVLRTL